MSSVRLGSVSLAKLLARRRQVAARDTWSRLTLDAHERRELDELRNFAYARSRFYRRFHDGKEHAQLPDLPVLTKTILMEHWDEVVTDPSISLDRVLRFVEGLGAPALLDDRYFVATTSGTTGLKGHSCTCMKTLVIPEIVDDHNRPVPSGTYGSKLLVTVLFSRTLPLIRYVISDSVAMSTEACECGLPFGIIDAVRGRREDVLSFDGESGHVLVQPASSAIRSRARQAYANGRSHKRAAVP